MQLSVFTQQRNYGTLRSALVLEKTCQLLNVPEHLLSPARPPPFQPETTLQHSGCGCFYLHEPVKVNVKDVAKELEGIYGSLATYISKEAFQVAMGVNM